MHVKIVLLMLCKLRGNRHESTTSSWTQLKYFDSDAHLHEVVRNDIQVIKQVWATIVEGEKSFTPLHMSLWISFQGKCPWDLESM
jgi:hypothetical protein